MNIQYNWTLFVMHVYFCKLHAPVILKLIIEINIIVRLIYTRESVYLSFLNLTGTHFIYKRLSEWFLKKEI